MRKKIIKLFVLVLIYTNISLSAQSADLLVSKLFLTYTKLTDGTKKIDLVLQSSVDDKKVFIADGKITVYAVSPTGNLKLGELITDSEGKGVFLIKSGTKLPVDQDNFFTISASYDGNKKFDKATGEVRVKDAFLEMTLTQKDTIRTINAVLYELNDKNDKVFIKDADIDFYVTRLFCLFNLGTVKTDSTGSCSVPFQEDIRADTAGMVNLVVKLNNSDDYGTIENNKNVKWGKPLEIIPKKRRGLGDTDAPLWMVYTLIILLSGTWIHYMVVMLMIYFIKRESKKNPVPAKT